MNAASILLPALFILCGFATVVLVIWLMFQSEKEELRQRWTPPGGMVLVRQERYAAMAALAEDIYELLGDLENPQLPGSLADWDMRVEVIRKKVGKARKEVDGRTNAGMR